MRFRLTITALSVAACAVLAGPAAARPYLMLSADDQGFQALDLSGAAHGTQPTVEITLIDAVLSGQPYGDKVAPLVERRVEVDCTQERWRVLSSNFVDAHEVVLSKGDAAGDWRPFGENLSGPVIQAAACRREFRQAAVSRFLNIGEILTNYQAAHGAGVPQPKTRQQLLAERFRRSH
jgi:hypothetical protein